MVKILKLSSLLALLCGVLALPAHKSHAEEVVTRGPVTNLPMPRFVSMKAAEGNVRRGPSSTHRVDWVFKRRDMPLQVVGEYGHWRRVIDREGVGGWMHYSLLSGTRTVLIEEDMMPLREDPEPDAYVTAYVERGVVARLGACEDGWCELRIGQSEGWTPIDNLWGVNPGELRD